MPKKAIDLVGKTYGKLTVMTRAENQGRRVMWLCQCECGNTTVVRGDSLKDGSTKSCGCLHKEEAVERQTKNIEGEKFGRLTVVSKIDSEENGSSLWLCGCECGNEVIVSSARLKSGNTKSCGCLQREKVREIGCNNWKGGIQIISTHLRSLGIVKQWKMKAILNSERKCEVTGGGEDLEIHHIKPFNEIVYEAHTINNIEIKQNVELYTKEELALLEEYVAEWHKETSNAIVMQRNVHRYFHDVFMKGKGRESSIEDVEEFKEHYKNQEVLL